MKKIKIAINGFGRVGRQSLKAILTKKNLEITAINDLTDNKTLAHLLKYDSLYGKYEKEINFDKEYLIINGKKIKVFAESDPEKLPWKRLGIDIVLECTGRFTLKEEAEKHLKAGAKKVIISAPSKSHDIPTYVLGVNEKKYNSKEKIISCGSCTTNCLAPVVKVLHQNFGIKQGFMTTIHSYTNDQKILDLPHKDLRRARAAGLSIIPTTTGAAKTVEKTIPELKGKLDGIALRVPTPTVSIIDFQAIINNDATAEQVNKAFIKAQEKELKGILDVSDEPLVSMDYKGNDKSSIVDLALTMAKNNLVKVVAWYDNEWAYACRLVELAEYIG
ncbi:MAG: glyceraldehyde 3-phosphate dehydrogenase [Parcubacteria group bacterium Athens1014_10]|nr:MAG: glyceraldehyde 3-phosphate dehydrogenase [Parcubacteria group bacterium Athens1014_10]TSD06074.1 MAG: glyceraldehyde 3-phosphate dehydrogenase [Parcubacteria group bacterium Athens0714_12]